MSTIYLQHHIDTLIRMSEFISSQTSEPVKKVEVLEEEEDSDEDVLYIEDDVINEQTQRLNEEES